MTPKTLTTIGRLQIGDRFYFVGNKKEVQQLKSFTNNKACYNKVINNESATGYHFEKTTGINKEVIFLRSTIERVC